MAYDINIWVQDNLGKDISEMMLILENEHAVLKNMELSDRRKPEGFFEYLKYMQGFNYFVATRRKPASNNLHPFRPIIQDWADRGLIDRNLLKALF